MMDATMQRSDSEERPVPRRRSRAAAALPDGAAPLFVAGGLWAAFAMSLWLLALGGAVEIPGPLTPLDWHVHELLYGFVPAIAVGYMMTMVANWSGRLPVHGPGRAVLLALWLAGRLALLSAPPNGVALAAVIDVGFLLLAWCLVAREAFAGRDRRAARLLSPLGVLVLGNALFHWQAIHELSPATGMPTRLGVAAAVMLLTLVGGLLVPSFTRRWLLETERPTLPPPVPLLETATHWGSAVALLAWAVEPAHPGSGAMLFGAGLLQLARWLQWRPWRTVPEPLVLALQVGYGFVPAGFLMLGFAALVPDFGWPRHGDAVHAWTAGAVGTCMLAMMIRVALRRARLPARADVATTTMLGAVVGAGLLRSIGGLNYEFAVGLAAGGWIAAFAGYVLVFGPMLSAPPPARRAG
jgi:uncharacterized protein involved in response to NO